MTKGKSPSGDCDARLDYPTELDQRSGAQPEIPHPAALGGSANTCAVIVMLDARRCHAGSCRRASHRE